MSKKMEQACLANRKDIRKYYKLKISPDTKETGEMTDLAERIHAHNYDAGVSDGEKCPSCVKYELRTREGTHGPSDLIVVRGHQDPEGMSTT